jgi:hypothetical protein
VGEDLVRRSHGGAALLPAPAMATGDLSTMQRVIVSYRRRSRGVTVVTCVSTTFGIFTLLEQDGGYGACVQ